ncbi:ribosomal RNA small subunit methyltransferase A [Patescibacteria group bacterium]|nr:ribosomal RNA small subunit methyltransferase A [Patescibacteria group bacterium]
MDLTNLSTLQRVMREYHVFAQKKLGQNFLIDKQVLDTIIEASSLKNTEDVLEIGPGLGTLTRALAGKAKEVITVEKDIHLIKIFRALNSDLANIKAIEGNALFLDKPFFDRYFKKSYKLIANLPYYITSAIIRFFLQSPRQPSLMILMVQKEVAERIIALPPAANILSVAVQFYGQPEIVAEVPNTSFWPSPTVDSAILKIVPYSRKPYKVTNEKEFFKIIKAGFSERRKQLHNSLGNSLQLPDKMVKKALIDSKIDSSRRAQTLSIEEWVTLYQNLKRL